MRFFTTEHRKSYKFLVWGFFYYFLNLIIRTRHGNNIKIDFLLYSKFLVKFSANTRQTEHKSNIGFFGYPVRFVRHNHCSRNGEN